MALTQRGRKGVPKPPMWPPIWDAVTAVARAVSEIRPAMIWPSIRESAITTAHAIFDWGNKVTPLMREKRAERKAARLQRDADRQSKTSTISDTVITPPPYDHEFKYDWDFTDMYLFEEMKNGVRSRIVGASGRLTHEKVTRALKAAYKEDVQLVVNPNRFDIFYRHLEQLHPECCDGRKPDRQRSPGKAKQAQGSCLVMLFVYGTLAAGVGASMFLMT